ncbi:MAG TPA: hypothetical protein DCP97_02220 [Ruminococcaceae bacterium]|nr:hypothetical protein [Oscillospiraceae bacterium]
MKSFIKTIIVFAAVCVALCLFGFTSPIGISSLSASVVGTSSIGVSSNTKSTIGNSSVPIGMSSTGRKGIIIYAKEYGPDGQYTELVDAKRIGNNSVGISAKAGENN